MAPYWPPIPQTDDLIAEALHLVQVDHYANEADPHLDASREYTAEQVALKARALVRAVDAMPADSRPIGWDKDAEENDQTRALHETALRSALRSAMCGPRNSVDAADAATAGWLAHLALTALAHYVPDEAARVVEFVDRGVAGGDYFADAWDAAEARGMDVQQWADAARAHRAAPEAAE